MYRYFPVARALPVAALFIALLSAPLVAQSQARPDPADAGAPAPPAEYKSVFSGFQTFREQKGTAWKEVNKEVADNPGMGPMHSMQGMSGKGMAGMDDKGGKGDMAGMAPHGAMPKSQASAGGKGMAGHGATGGGSTQPSGPPGKPAAAGHRGAMAGAIPGQHKPAAPTALSAAPQAHGPMAMAAPQSSAAAATPPQAPTGPVSGTGVIQQIDKANGKVRMTHEPIDALGWPRMTMVFRLKDGALADQVKEGDKITFSLEKAASGYVISSFGKPAGGKEAAKPHRDHDMGKGETK